MTVRCSGARPSSDTGPALSGSLQLGTMAYDEALAARIRELLADAPDITEKKMFGGLAFLVRGNMAIAASRLSWPVFLTGT